MTANLEESCLPSYEINLLGKVDKSGLPWTPEGQVYELNCRLVECLNRLDRRGKYGSYYLRDGSVVRHENHALVTLPPFDGDVDHIEDWCRKFACQLREEEYVA